MAQVSPAHGHTPHPTIRSALLSGAAAPDFSLAFSALLGTGGADDAVAEPPGDADAARQAIAGTGKDLPAALLRGAAKRDGEADDNDDTDEDGRDIAFAWFGPGAALPDAAPASEGLPQQTAKPVAVEAAPARRGAVTADAEAAAVAVVGRGGQPAPPTAPGVETHQPFAPALPAASPAPQPAPGQPHPAPAQPITPGGDVATAAKRPASADTARQTRVDAISVGGADPAPPAAPIRVAVRAQANAAPVTAAPVTTAAVLRHAAAAEPRAEAAVSSAAPIALTDIRPLPQQQRRQTPQGDAAVAALALDPAGATVRAHAVAPSQAIPQPALDTSRHEWIAAMVDRVATMRDAAQALHGTHETQIRLAPDALGTIDIALRQDGDRVHVHIATETAAAQALISDAQPRLAEIAAERGVRLGDTQVSLNAGPGSGSPQGQSGHQQPDAQRTRAAPASAPLSAGVEDAATDQRIA